MTTHRYFWGYVQRRGHHDPAATIEKELSFLSNFHMASMVIDGKLWMSVEHYYQAQKFVAADAALAESIRTVPTPRLAKNMGSAAANKGKLSKSWDKDRVDVMRRALAAKFRDNRKLRERLIATAPAVLHEDSPTDAFWGVKGEDQLGKLLCELRDEFTCATPGESQ